MHKANIQTVKRTTTATGKSLWWLITREMGAPHFELRYLELKKSESTSGKGHAWEHEVYVTRGNGEIRGDHETVPIREGDAILILPHEKHEIVNHSDDPLGFICVIPNGAEDMIKQK
jgi:quercetin dioxygenase-like cupin family protein